MKFITFSILAFLFLPSPSLFSTQINLSKTSTFKYVNNYWQYQVLKHQNLVCQGKLCVYQLIVFIFNLSVWCFSLQVYAWPKHCLRVVCSSLNPVFIWFPDWCFCLAALGFTCVLLWLSECQYTFDPSWHKKMLKAFCWLLLRECFMSKADYFFIRPYVNTRVS